MQHVGRVDVFKTTEGLVDERLEVGIRQWLARADLRDLEMSSIRIITAISMNAYNSVEIGLHELLVEVHFVEITTWLEDDVHIVEACNLARGERCRSTRSSSSLRTFL